MDIINFYKEIYREDRIRINSNRLLIRDLWLYTKNRLCQPVEHYYVNKYYTEKYPLIFIVGSPRSGTTLLYQLMAQFLDIGFINNFVSRYWMTPIYGMKRYQSKFLSSNPTIHFISNLGSTAGIHAPHEFGYFWQFWMGKSKTDDLTEEELSSVNWQAIRKELYALANWLQMPLVLKNVNHTNYNIHRFSNEFQNCCFLWIHRSPNFTVQSILESRIKQYGNEYVWWSIRPRNMDKWLHYNPIQQVCHQVNDVNYAVQQAFKDLPPSRKLLVEYEELIANPYREIKRISKFLGGVTIPHEFDLKKVRLNNSNKVRISNKSFKLIENTFKKM